MSIGEICNREVIFVQRDTTVLEAARLMRQYHVGALVVVEPGKSQPSGIVTDRDLVVEVVAPELDASVITVGDIMVADAATVTEKTGVFEAIRTMRDKAVRRMPVIDDQGELVGIVSLDDLLSLLAEELSQLSAVVAREQNKELRTRN